MIQELKFHMRLRVFCNDPHFGPGIATLMCLVREKESLSAACKEMGMAYSKAWKILKKAEADLGISLMEGQRGGERGGRTVLTEEGTEFLDTYLAFSAEAMEAVNGLYHKYYH